MPVFGFRLVENNTTMLETSRISVTKRGYQMFKKVHKLWKPKTWFPTWKRREWTANPADPTQVIEWKLEFKRLPIEIRLLSSWGVDAKVYYRAHVWWTYNSLFFRLLQHHLEDNFQRREAAFGDDGYGNLRMYE